MERFGKTIIPFDEVNHRIDLSCPKIGILTYKRARINEEFTAIFKGKMLKLGIIEFDEEYWVPFRWDPNPDFYEKRSDSDDDDDEEDKSISDTNMEDWGGGGQRGNKEKCGQRTTLTRAQE
ncbi:unnamed protein product [Lactuca virosa]|uniref:DUF4283 domain-containing protein n=1 Tax=Lactuca virosa TaxID=75947 RepID=A0AAU9MZM3_9ASTR|nr:unnamed protein product [Lactuca virosa]